MGREGKGRGGGGRRHLPRGMALGWGEGRGGGCGVQGVGVGRGAAPLRAEGSPRGLLVTAAAPQRPEGWAVRERGSGGTRPAQRCDL